MSYSLPGMAEQREDTRIDFAQRSMINNRQVPSPGNIQGWSDRGVPCDPTGRATWTAEHLEGLIRDKIKQKIGSGNGQVWEAFRLFCGGGDTDEVTPEQFKLRVRAADLVHA